MKKRIIIISICLLIILGGIAVYAAFTFDVNMKMGTQNFNLFESTESEENQTLVVTDMRDNAPVQTLNMTFTNPGDSYTYLFSYSNKSDKIVRYETIINPFDSIDTFKDDVSKTETLSKIEGQILIFLDDTFIGMISDIKENNFFPTDKVVLPNESLEFNIRFELHNAVMLEQDVNFKFNIQPTVYTANVQEYSTVNDVNQFKENLLAVESGLAKTLILTVDITLTDLYEITKPFTVDLHGHTLDINWKLTALAKVKIINSKTSGEIKGTVELNSADAFLNVEATQSLTTALTSFCYADLVSYVDKTISKKDWITSGTAEEFDILKNNSFYLSVVTLTSTNGSLENGVLTQRTALHKTIVCRLTMSYKDAENTRTYDIKILGQGTETVLNEIVTNELAHITYYEVNTTNPTEQMYLSSDLFLPTALKKYNCTIEWESYNKTLISNRGIVQTGANGEVTLHARIKINEVYFDQDFRIYVAKETNEQKLARLLAEINITFTDILPNDGSSFALPTADNYSDWLGGEDLGITSLTYTIDPIYDYLIMVGDKLSLSKLTFDRTAEISVVATFDSGNSTKESGTIHVEIDLSANDALLNEILSIVQQQLDSIDVLQNLLDTREGGLSSEKGDFTLITEYKGFTISYEAPALDSGLYNGEYEVSGNTIITHPEKFKTSDTYADLIVKIGVNGTNTYEKNATFRIPATIHLSDMKNNEALFYSVKMQVLNQVTAGLTNVTVPTDLNGMKTIFAEETNGNHNDYILMDDILNCHSLVIKTASTGGVTLDYHDISEIIALIQWATSPTVSKVTDLTITTAHKDLQSDGQATISDAEELLILEYCEKFPHFEAYWNDLFYKNTTVDNILTQDEITKLEALLLDENLSLLLDWATNNDGTNILAKDIQGLAISGIKDKVMTTLPLGDIIGNYTSDGAESISNFEEEVILRYCLAKEYTEFIKTWGTYITRQDNNLDQQLTAMNNYTLNNFLYATLNNNTKTVAETVFESLCDFMSTTNDGKLGDYVTNKEVRTFYGLDENVKVYYTGAWIFKDDVLGDEEKKVLKSFFVDNHFMTEAEWTAGNFQNASKIGNIQNNLAPYLVKGKADTKTDLDSIITWAKGTTLQSFSSIGITIPNGKNLESPFNNIINDGKATISYPEYNVIYHYLVEVYIDSTKFTNDTDNTQKNAFVKKILDVFLNLEFNNPLLTAESRKVLLSKIANGLDVYQNMITLATSMGVADETEGYDGLPSISQTEHNKILNYVKNNDSLKLKYAQYEILFNQYVHYSSERKLTARSETDTSIYKELIAYSDFDSYFNSIRIHNRTNTAYNYFDVPQFTEAKCFNWLIYFKNLVEFHLFGTAELPAFSKPSDANQVLDYVVRYCPNLQILDMNYTHLSDISVLSKGQNLKSISIRGNSNINELSSLVAIPEGQIEFLNIVDVFEESEFRLSEAVLNKLYLSYVELHSVEPKLLYRHNTKVIYYDPTIETIDGFDYLFLLKDLNIIDYTNHQLIPQVTKGGTTCTITWAVVSGPVSIEKTASGATRIVRNSKAESVAIITASVTLEGIKYARYFYVELPEIVETGGASS